MLNASHSFAAPGGSFVQEYVHGVVIVRNGKLAFEHYFRGFDLKARAGPGIIDFNSTTTHDLRSMTKSVTALVLGVAIDRGIIAN
jgi:CubicO group peptidase (beta-lactamase class C family)